MSNVNRYKILGFSFLLMLLSAPRVCANGSDRGMGKQVSRGRARAHPRSGNWRLAWTADQ